MRCEAHAIYTMHTGLEEGKRNCSLPDPSRVGYSALHQVARETACHEAATTAHQARARLLDKSFLWFHARRPSARAKGKLVEILEESISHCRRSAESQGPGSSLIGPLKITPWYLLYTTDSGACSLSRLVSSNLQAFSQMAEHQRKIELQCPDDLTYLVDNIKKAAQEKVDLHLPPSAAQGKDDAFRFKVEEHVQQVKACLVVLV